MSLSIGQNPGYINNIESGKASPSLAGIFYICDYLGVTPKEFFDTELHNPTQIRTLVNAANKLDDDQLNHLIAIVEGMNPNKK